MALDCGFSSSSTFARAFKAFHGVSASQWRQNRNFGKPVRKNCKAQPAGLTASLIDESDPLRERAYTMNLKVSVRQVAPMNVAYLRHVGPFQENAALFERLLGRIRGWAEARGLLLPSASLLSISHDAPEITAAEKLRLDVALTVPEGTPVGGEIGGQRLEGGSYAVSRVRIRANQFSRPGTRSWAAGCPAAATSPMTARASRSTSTTPWPIRNACSTSSSAWP